jgi:CRP-like cAMP-binding protein
MSSAVTDKAEILQRVGLFSGVFQNKDALKALADIMTVENCPVGKKLLVEGELGDEFFILISGQVSVLKKTGDEDTFKVAILTGAMTPSLGEAGLIEAEPRSATISCDTECQFLRLTRSTFAKFCDQNPGWAVPILKKIASQVMARLRQSDKDILLLHEALMNEIRG